ncbi:hypothetical protein TDB9533_04782 [Thalassocella blandensis]|nr:hypothetical protein TDB9533_04782 [Thalassocella blandensis]
MSIKLVLKFIKYAALITFTFLIYACGDASAMKIDKPSYFVKLNMTNCPRMIVVNGIEIEQDFEGSSNYSEYPINHYIKNGENKFELLVGEKDYMEDTTTTSSQCSAEIRVRGSVRGEKVDYKITDITYTPNYTENIKDLYKKSASAGSFIFSKENTVLGASHESDFAVSEISLGEIYFDGVGATFGRTFTVSVPFGRWAFFDADQTFEIPYEEKYEDYKSAVAKLVVDLEKVFDSRDVNKILPLFESRSKEIDDAFYKQKGETQMELKKSLEFVFQNDFPLKAFDESTMELVISYDGRLATLVDAGNMIGTIYFRDTEAETYTSYTVYWMKKDGKWIIAR